VVSRCPTPTSHRRRRIGKVPQEKAVSRGEHFVVVRLSGFKTFEQKVRIEPGQTLTVSAELKAVGRVRIISDPAGAEVQINGLPQGVTPLELRGRGRHHHRAGDQGRLQTWEQTLNMEGGKTETLSANLRLEGMSDEELSDEQRGLASFGARTLPRGRSTVDFGIGYPYFLETRINVGAGKVGDFGFDAGVGVRTMGSRSELGMGVRFMLVDSDPFSAGAFGDLWWGSRLIDDSKRNGLTFNAGAVASLTAFTRVTVSGRLYLNMWTDRHCPEADDTQPNHFDGDPIAVCKAYEDGSISPEDMTRANELTDSDTEADFFGRDSGMRVMTSVIAEIALYQRWNGWFILEGAPFQSERALYTDMFSAPLSTATSAPTPGSGATHKF
jgi:hypothetical protein